MKIIVAACKNLGISSKINYHGTEADLVNFKNLTIGNGNNAIMGSNTWKRFPNQPLPNRFIGIINTLM